MTDEKDELKKEFELERMVLFSDAVFAISITLLVLEIRFPDIEKGASSHEILLAFKPVAVRFLGFFISFLFTGIMWARHLKIFRFLHTYNNGVIFRNLVFLFFIVCFSFSASGITEHIRPGFYLPFLIYVINLACISVAQYALCRFLFGSRSSLTIAGYEAEKKYLLLQSKFAAIIFSVTATIMILFSIIFGNGSDYVVFSFYLLPAMAIFTRKRLKKYKPPTPVQHTDKVHALHAS